jgi:hypothetical protein
MRPHTIAYLLFMVGHLKSTTAFNAWLKREGYDEVKITHIHRMIEDQPDTFKRVKYESVI